MAFVSLLQLNDYPDELPIPSVVATAAGRNVDKALAHASRIRVTSCARVLAWR